MASLAAVVMIVQECSQASLASSFQADHRPAKASGEPSGWWMR